MLKSKINRPPENGSYSDPGIRYVQPVGADRLLNRRTEGVNHAQATHQ